MVGWSSNFPQVPNSENSWAYELWEFCLDILQFWFISLDLFFLAWKGAMYMYIYIYRFFCKLKLLQHAHLCCASRHRWWSSNLWTTVKYMECGWGTSQTTSYVVSCLRPIWRKKTPENMWWVPKLGWPSLNEGLSTFFGSSQYQTHQFLIGNTSSNGCFSIVMWVFQGVVFGDFGSLLSAFILSGVQLTLVVVVR